MTDSDNEPRPSWLIMAEFAEFVPEVPVPLLEAMAHICVEDDLETRTMAGFDLINALNDLKLITLISQTVTESEHGFVDIPDFEFPPDYDRPRFSRYGFRLDRPPQPGDAENGHPVLAEDVWVGDYTVHIDNDNQRAIRFVVSFDEQDDPTHPDVIEWWLAADKALQLAANLTKHAS